MTKMTVHSDNTFAQFIEKTKLGICIKDSLNQTLYKNAHVIDACNDDPTSGSDELFLRLSQKKKWEQLRDGLHLFKFQHVEDEFYDILVLKNEDHLAIFTYPLKGRNLCSPHYIETKTLTEKERLVISLMMAKRSNQDIASELGISINTLKTHVKNIYKKLSPEAKRTLRRLRTGAETKLEPAD